MDLSTVSTFASVSAAAEKWRDALGPTRPRHLLYRATCASVMALAVSLSGCARVGDEVVTPSNHDKVLEDVAKSGMSDEDKRMYAAAMARSAMSTALSGTTGVAPYTVDGKTVSQIVGEEVTWAADEAAQADAQKAAQEKEEAREAALAAELRQSISVVALEKHYQNMDFENGVTDSGLVVKFQFHNLGRKLIRAFKGTLEFDNQFGDKIDVVPLDREDPIPAGATQVADLIQTYRPESDRLSTTPLSHMRVTWIPSSVLYGDGSIVSASPSP